MGFPNVFPRQPKCPLGMNSDELDLIPSRYSERFLDVFIGIAVDAQISTNLSEILSTSLHLRVLDSEFLH